MAKYQIMILYHCITIEKILTCCILISNFTDSSESNFHWSVKVNQIIKFDSGLDEVDMISGVSCKATQFLSTETLQILRQPLV